MFGRMTEAARERLGEAGPMQRKAFATVAAAIACMGALLLGALAVSGRVESANGTMAEAMQTQMDFFEDDMRSLWEELFAGSVRLSQDVAAATNGYLEREGMAATDLTDSPERIAALQKLLFTELEVGLLQSQASGAFTMLDCTVNTQAADPGESHSGVYLQRSTSRDSQGTVLYRGDAALERATGAQMHPKWQLEFRADSLSVPFACFETFREVDDVDGVGDTASAPADAAPASVAATDGSPAYLLSPIFRLPGTGEDAVLITVPVRDEQGGVIGVCGLEMTRSRFREIAAQQGSLDHLLFTVTPHATDSAETADLGLACGTTEGYFLAPRETPVQTGSLGGIGVFSADGTEYVGLTRTVELRGGASLNLAVFTPKADYDRAVTAEAVQTSLFALIIAGFATAGCLYASRRIMAPVASEMAERDRKIAERDRQMAEHDRAAERRAQEDRLELERLSYRRSNEIDPDDFDRFVAGLRNLTPTERRIFGWYAEGRSAKEVMELAGIKESTLRYHNKNIYRKLGVSSLKQMLRYATLLKRELRKAAK